MEFWEDILANFCIMIMDVVVQFISMFSYVFILLAQLMKKTTPKAPKNILITGASSGIGEELARQYCKTASLLILSARRKDMLESVKAACNKINPKCKVEIKELDVADTKATLAFMEEASKRNMDLVIANAGTGVNGVTIDKKYIEQANATMMANFVGVFNTLAPFMENMKSRKEGHLAVVSSVAGNGFGATGPVYYSTKTGVRLLMEGMGASLAKYNVTTSIIQPGFVKTKMTSDIDKALWIIPVEEAVQIIMKGLANGDHHICFPRKTHVLTSVMGRFIPAMYHHMSLIYDFLNYYVYTNVAQMMKKFKQQQQQEKKQD